MPQFMLLLYEEAADYSDIGAEEMQRIIEKYAAWSAGLAEQGRMRGGEKLRDGSGRVIHRGGAEVTDGPYSETKEVIGGYFAIEAADYDEAVALARECPHRDFGTIEVREVEVIPAPAAAQ